MPEYRIELVHGPSGFWFWRIVERNGQTLAHSESYHSKWNARRTAKQLAKLTHWPIVEVPQ